MFDDLVSPRGIRRVWESRLSPELVSSTTSESCGYLLGPADVYGGDYTVYPTLNPSISHAIATIAVVFPPDKLESSSPLSAQVGLCIFKLICLIRFLSKSFSHSVVFKIKLGSNVSMHFSPLTLKDPLKPR